jgi:hypothetical protein
MARIVDKTPKHLLPARISLIVERFGVALYGQQKVCSCAFHGLDDTVV